MDSEVGVLITGAGAPGAPGIIYCLNQQGDMRLRLVGVDIDEGAVGFSLVDNHYVIPQPETDEFIPKVLDICERENIRVILPLVTRELIPLSKAKKDFNERGVYIPISDEDVMKVLNDKHKLSVRAKEAGVSVPNFHLATNIAELRAYASELGYPDRPVCIKPPISNGMRGLRILDENKDRLELLLSEKPTGVYSTLDEVIAILEGADDFPPYLVMEYLPGEEYTIDALADKGEMVVSVPRLRQRIRSGISFDARVVRDKRLIEMTRLLIEGLDIDGVCGFQFRESDEGTPCLIESNPRLQGTVILTAGAGVNIPYLLVRMALGEKIEVGNIKWGMSIKRYWGWFFFDKDGSPYPF